MNRRSNPLRAFLSGVLLLVAVAMVPVTLVSVWVRDTALNTDNFVALYQPVAGKSTFQSFVASQVSDTAAAVVEDAGVLESAGSSASEVDRFLGQFGVDLGLADTAADWSERAAELVRETVYQQTIPLVQSSKFQSVWTESLRQLHSQVVAGLDGSSDGSLTLQAAPFVEMLRERLQEQGVAVASFIPSPGSNVQIPIAKIELSEHAQTGYSLLTEYGRWIPWANVSVLLLGLLFANWRSRALSRAAFGIALLAGLVWWGAPRVGHLVLVDAMGTEGGQGMAELLWQVGVVPLQQTSFWVTAVALGISIIAALFHLLTRGR